MVGGPGRNGASSNDAEIGWVNRYIERVNHRPRCFLFVTRSEEEGSGHGVGIEGSKVCENGYRGVYGSHWVE